MLDKHYHDYCFEHWVKYLLLIIARIKHASRPHSNLSTAQGPELDPYGVGNCGYRSRGQTAYNSIIESHFGPALVLTTTVTIF